MPSQQRTSFQRLALIAIWVTSIACSSGYEEPQPNAPQEEEGTQNEDHSNAETSTQSCAEVTGDLELNAHRIKVSGRLTFQGRTILNAPWATEPENIVLHFVEQTTNIDTLAVIEPNTEGRYSVELTPGQYDVSMVTSSAGTNAVIDNLELDDSQDLELNLNTRSIGVTVAFNGSKFPEAPEGQSRGRIVFKSLDNPLSHISVALPTTGDAFFRVELPSEQEYAVWWVHTGELENSVLSCRSTPNANVIPYGAVALDNLTLPNRGPVRMDVIGEVKTIAGIVTDGGQPLPSSRIEQKPSAWLTFKTQGEQPWRIAQIALRSEDRNTYSLRVIEDDYSLSLTTGPEPIGGLSSYIIAEVCETCITSEGCHVGDASFYNLDVRNLIPDSIRHPINGTVQLTGAQWPSDDADTSASGVLYFKSLDGEEPFISQHSPLGDELIYPRYSVSVDAQGRFEHEIKAGRYKVTLTSTSNPDLGGSTVLHEELIVDAPLNALEFNAVVVRFQGEMKVNGESMADNGILDGASRGYLSLINADGQYDARFDLGAEGPARFEKFVLAGNYKAHVHAYGYVGRSDVHPLNQDVLPTGSKELGEVVVAPEMEGSIHVIHATVRRITGTLEHSGFENVVQEGEAYTLRFMSEDQHAFWLRAPENSGTFEVLLYDGVYDIEVGDVLESWDTTAEQSYPAFLLSLSGDMKRTAWLGRICVDSAQL